MGRREAMAHLAVRARVVRPALAVPDRDPPRRRGVRLRVGPFLAVALSLVAGLGGASERARAAAITVTTPADVIAFDSKCSLREAVGRVSGVFDEFSGCVVAGTDNPWVITIPAGTYTLTIPGAGEDGGLTGDLDLGPPSASDGLRTVVLDGAGSGTTIIDGNGLDRVLDMHDFTLACGCNTFSFVAVSGLTITGGRAPAGADGGGIRSIATLMLDEVVVTGNRAGDGEDGGVVADDFGPPGGAGGSGGGIHTSEALELNRSTIADNAAGDGGAGGTGASSGGRGGAGGGGGGMYSSTGMSLVDSVVTGNDAGRGGDGGPPNAGQGGGGGSGGGVLLDGPASTFSSSSMTITGTTLSNNRAGDGGAPLNEEGGAGGSGGAIRAIEDSLSIVASTLSGNSAGNGGAPAGGALGAGGRGGSGGGVAAHTDHPFAGNHATVLNSTIAGNSAGAGGLAAAGGSGGGVIYDGAALELGHVTVSSNTASDGEGGGLQILTANASVVNSVIAANAPENCAGPASPPADGGHNVSFPDSTCPGLTTNPLLAPLADNGGATKTIALGEQSSAIDLVPTSAAGCLGTDQRGTSRPQRNGCDAGAYEAVPLPPPTREPPPESPPNSPPPAPIADITAPVASLHFRARRLRRALRRGLVAAVAVNEPSAALIELILIRRTARGVKRVRVASGRVTFASANRKLVPVSFTSNARRALADRRRVRLRARLVVTDSAGNTARRTTRITLRR